MHNSLSAITTRHIRRRFASLASLSGLLFLPIFLAKPEVVTAPTSALPAFSAAEFFQAQAKVDTVMVDWRMLGGLNYDTGEMTDTLRKLNGKVVKIPGFVVPLEDFEEEAAEFLLVPYFGACVHTPPPPPNQLVFVKMANKKKMKVGLWDAVWMYGTLKVEFVESVYGPASFTLEGLRTAPYGTP
jgi:uncharacterized protein